MHSFSLKIYKFNTKVAMQKMTIPKICSVITGEISILWYNNLPNFRYSLLVNKQFSVSRIAERNTIPLILTLETNMMLTFF